MNNRKRLIARVYRQNHTLSTRHRFERKGIAFRDGFSEAIREAAESLRKFGLAAMEASRAFDWIGKGINVPAKPPKEDE